MSQPYLVDERALRQAISPSREHAAPPGLLDSIVEQVAATRQRRVLRLPWTAANGFVLPRQQHLTRLAMVAMLLLALAAALVVIGQQRTQPTPLANGLVTFGRGGDIWIVPPQGGDPLPLATTAGTLESDPVYSPDGSLMAFFSTTAENAPVLIEVMRPDGTDRRTLTPGGIVPDSWTLSWASDNRNLVTDESVRGFPRVILLSVDEPGALHPLATPGPAQRPAWSRDGRWIAITRQVDGDDRLSLVHPDGSGLRELPRVDDGVGRIWDVTWAPGSTELIITREQLTPNRSVQLYVLDVSSESWTQIPTAGRRAYAPRLSRDGSRIAFASDSGSCREDILLMDRDGGNLRTLLNGSFLLDWSPDNSEILAIVVGEPRRASGGIIAVDVASGTTRIVAPFTQADLPSEYGNDPCAWYPGFRGVAWQGIPRR